MVKVSVIMPCYNSAKFMKKSIEYVLNQTLKDIELICINDKSNDSTLKKLREIQKKDNRVKIIDNKKNLGPGGSRNRGVSKANGEYIVFCDSDDWLELDSCENLHSIAKKENSDIVYIKPKILVGNKIKKDKRVFREGEIESVEAVFRKNLRREIAWAPWSKMVKRELLIKNKIIFPDIHISEDMVFSAKVIFYARKISECKDYIYNYLIREGSLMSFKNSERRIENYLECIKIIEDFLKEKGITDKFREDFIYFKLYNYMATYGVLAKTKEDIDKKKYREKVRKDPDFNLRNVFKIKKLNKVFISTLLIKLGLFVPIFRTYDFFYSKVFRLNRVG